MDKQTIHLITLIVAIIGSNAWSHSSLSDRMTALETRLTSLETRVDAIDKRLDKVEQTVAEGYKRIYSWKDDMYKNFPLPVFK